MTPKTHPLAGLDTIPSPNCSLWSTWYQQVSRQLINPGKNISVDEGCCPWKGRLRFRQYNPRKPAKFHIKLFQVSDPVTGYVIHFSVYTGKGLCYREGIIPNNPGLHNTTTKNSHDALLRCQSLGCRSLRVFWQFLHFCCIVRRTIFTADYGMWNKQGLCSRPSSITV